MDNKTISYKTFDSEKPEGIEYDVRPKPSDFDKFVPWACKEYHVDATVIVTRVVQAVYVSAEATNKKRAKRKTSKPMSIIIPENDLNIDFSSSDFEPVPAVAEKIVNIETVYDSNQYLVQLKLLRNKFIPRALMQVLALTIPYQRHLSSITINSGFHMNALYEMSKFLPISLITELCLDGTFLREANYHILLINSKLKHISLARCMINDSVVKLIAEQLKEPCASARILSVLNLSTNRITDIGAKYLANVLRTNRQLCYLNLTGNMITDEGGVSILNTLQRFPLQSEELFESKTRYVDYLKKKQELINMFVIQLQAESLFYKNKKKTVKKATKAESQYWQQHYEIAEAQIILEKSENLAETKLGLFNEAFSPNNTETKDGLVHCLGNNILCYLNLAYNNLTHISVRKLLDVLTTQKALNRTPRGLIKVVIEGNLMPVACEEFEEISVLLASSITSHRKQSDAVTKRKSVSARSAPK